MRQLLVSMAAAALVSVGATAGVAGPDVAGSADPAQLDRYSDASIAYFEEVAEADYVVALGPIVPNPDEDAQQSHVFSKRRRLRGRVTRVQYAIDGDSTPEQVGAHYTSVLAAAGFRIVAQGQGGDALSVGGASWTLRAFGNLASEVANEIVATNDASTRLYLAARLQRVEGDRWVVLLANQRRPGELRVQLDVVDTAAALARGQDAEAFAIALAERGRVVVSEVGFEFGQSRVTAESKAALGEVAALLERDPELRLYVVAHTNAIGGLDYKTELSEKRARAVVERLVNGHRIDASRLVARGVGPLAPLATNDTQEGRRLNERVELVKQR